ncbi:MAG: hypothetical protein LBL35_07335 [Clostridiales bacterium]|nr:hypothetical protein [Clostridiales bacterium]
MMVEDRHEPLIDREQWERWRQL